MGLGAACRRTGALPKSFGFRLVRPAFHTDRLRLVGKGQTLCTVQGDGWQCCQATVGW